MGSLNQSSPQYMASGNVKKVHIYIRYKFLVLVYETCMFVETSFVVYGYLLRLSFNASPPLPLSHSQEFCTFFVKHMRLYACTDVCDRERYFIKKNCTSLVKLMRESNSQWTCYGNEQI